MNDLISRQAAIDLLKQMRKDGDMIPWEGKDVFARIRKLPSANCSEFPNNSDTISRQAAIDYFVTNVGFHDEDGYPIEDECELREIWTGYFDGIPSAQPKRGKWISADAIFGGVPFYCSECGENTRDTVMGKPRWNFCPNCGADMREVTT